MYISKIKYGQQSLALQFPSSLLL